MLGIIGELPPIRRGYVLAVMEQRLLRQGDLAGLREVRACRRARNVA